MIPFAAELPPIGQRDDKRDVNSWLNILQDEKYRHIWFCLRHAVGVETFFFSGTGHDLFTTIWIRILKDLVVSLEHEASNTPNELISRRSDIGNSGRTFRSVFELLNEVINAEIIDLLRIGSDEFPSSSEGHQVP